MKNIKILDASDPASEKDIGVLETALGRKIPGSLRMLLLRSDGGILDAENCVTFAKLPSGEEMRLEVQRFYSVAMILEALRDYEGRVPSNLLPIANNLSGDLFCLSLDERNPRIYFWDHEDEEEAYIMLDKIPAPGHANLYPVAPNLETFVDTLALDDS
ncbi:MAG: hypothetical protein JWQ71_4155 [Pedosphaera sp.]|nr:hypothetical protein [Pedosphaera sp.]